MDKKHFVNLGCGIALSFLLLGYMLQAETRNIQSLFFSEECKSACWVGIEPQISTTDEVVTALEKIYGFENVIRDSGTISWNVNNPNWNNRGYVLTNENKVTSIMIWFPEPYMEVRDFISEIGYPESVGLVISVSARKCASASLLYPEIGLIVHLSPSDKSIGVTETQIVNSFDIYPPWSSGNYPWTDTAVIPWDGYHEYCQEIGLGKNKILPLRYATKS